MHLDLHFVRCKPAGKFPMERTITVFLLHQADDADWPALATHATSVSQTNLLKRSGQRLAIEGA